jgi:hypothetical protein
VVRGVGITRTGVIEVFSYRILTSMRGGSRNEHDYVDSIHPLTSAMRRDGVN